jgi:DNA-binding NtrC family response regulator
MRAIVFGRLADLVPRAHAVLGRMGYRVVPLESFDQLRPTVEQSHPDDVFVAAVLDDQLSFQVSELLRRVRFRGRVLVLVEHLGHPGAAPLLQLARSRCALRPVSAGSLDTLLEQAVRWHEPVRDGSATPTFYGLVGRSDAMLSIFRRLEKIAASDANVCIYGESGTGKELVSRAIHLASPRGEQPFVTLDCTAVPEGLMESHLFGHVKGAFTGATDHREGVFSLANMGTLFIDELSDLSLPLQAKLLRVIQTREFTRVGGAKPIRTNIRLVTAMNKDPKRAVDEG